MLAATPTTAFLDVIADALEAALASDMNFGLFTGTPTLQPSMVIGDLPAPTFTGYAKVNVAAGTRRGNANGDIIIPFPAVTFQPTNTTDLPQTVTGSYAEAEGTPDTLWLAEFLDEPWEVVDTGSALDIIWEIYVRADSVYGGICTTCST